MAGMWKCQQCGVVSHEQRAKCGDCGAFAIMFLKEGESLLQPLNEVETSTQVRFGSGIQEVDIVLNKLHPGSLIVLCGEPGAGKSTLAIQVCANVADTGKKVIYFAGEESKAQVRERAKRVKADSASVLITDAMELYGMLSILDKERPDLVVIDSIQTVKGKPDEKNVIKLAGERLLNIAKALNTVIIVIGHVSKDDSLAGPRHLEHTVDIYMRIDLDRHGLRILSAQKNRFGSTDEIGVLQMKEKGLVSYNPEEAYTKKKNPREGTGLGLIKLGKRYMIVEVQTLLGGKKGQITAQGIAKKRVELVIAILEKHLRIKFEEGIFCNLALGISSSDPSLDLTIAAALLSSYTGKANAIDELYCGEMSLSGEVLELNDIDARTRAVKRVLGKDATVISSEVCDFIEHLIDLRAKAA